MSEERRRGASLDLWVTGGGTREPIDDVRYVGNRSTGRLAVAVAKAGLRAGHRVRLLLAVDVPEPEPHAALRVDRFETARDLHAALLAGSSPDALVHAAAVADYAPVPVAGKVPSGQERWTLEMVRLPKLAHAFREAHPRAEMVLFKLESQVEVEELVERARAAGRRAGAQRIFANLLQEVGAGSHAGWLVPVDGEARRVEGRESIASAIVASLSAGSEGGS